MARGRHAGVEVVSEDLNVTSALAVVLKDYWQVKRRLKQPLKGGGCH